MFFFDQSEYSQSDILFGMRAVYHILRNNCALIPPLWEIVDSYIQLLPDDIVMYALAIRPEPAISVRLISITDDLDETMSLKYSRGECDIHKWQTMDIINRLKSMKHRIYTHEYVFNFHNIYMNDKYNSKGVIELLAGKINMHYRNQPEPLGSPELRQKFLHAIFKPIQKFGKK